MAKHTWKWHYNSPPLTTTSLSIERHHTIHCPDDKAIIKEYTARSQKILDKTLALSLITVTPWRWLITSRRPPFPHTRSPCHPSCIIRIVHKKKNQFLGYERQMIRIRILDQLFIDEIRAKNTNNLQSMRVKRINMYWS